MIDIARDPPAASWGTPELSNHTRIPSLQNKRAGRFTDRDRKRPAFSVLADHLQERRRHLPSEPVRRSRFTIRPPFIISPGNAVR
jgi:hypothetical protein